eukprot:scaffold5626_cov70-Skeletonema_dohrnii-CCMP3373.AAC.2
MMCCAACGIAGVDDIKLRKCSACHSVRYCSVKCQRTHRPQHKRACKKRAAELRDEILFKQPESTHLGDCPICFLPLPIDNDKSTLWSCCCKKICNGCNYANQRREWKESLEKKCPFCRHPLPKSKEEIRKNYMKRIEVNDPVAIRHMGGKRYREGDYKGAVDYFKKAVKLGDAEANFQLSILYKDGEGGVEKDEKKEVYHLEEAAIGGDPDARHNLGVTESDNGRYDRAVKHWIIAANLGHEDSMHNVKEAYRDGLVSKEDFAAALRGHQAAIDAMKSPQREVAERFLREEAARGDG